MIKRYLPNKSIFTDLIIIYCKDCQTNHYVLTAPCCSAHKVEQCPTQNSEVIQ